MTACGKCRFWQRDEDENDAPRGQCRRYAPRPAHQWVAFNGEAVIAVADILSRHFNLEWPKGIAGEATETGGSAEWPFTYEDEWCGEFQARKENADGI